MTTLQNVFLVTIAAIIGSIPQSPGKSRKYRVPESGMDSLFVGRCAPATVQARLPATLRINLLDNRWGNMFAHTRTEHRLLGFDIGDWSILVVGFALVALLTLLV
jgi:hypothetical protein